MSQSSNSHHKKVDLRQYLTEKKPEKEENLILRFLKESKSDKELRIEEEEDKPDPIAFQIEYLRSIARKFSPMARE